MSSLVQITQDRTPGRGGHNPTVEALIIILIKALRHYEKIGEMERQSIRLDKA